MPPSAVVRVDGERSTLVLAGDWVAQAGSIPAFAVNSLDRSVPPRVLGIDVSGLGRWDSGLIAFLWDVKRGAARQGLALDPSALPESAQKLLQLLPQQADPAPGGSPARPSLLEWLGGRTIGLLATVGMATSLMASLGQSLVLALLGRVFVRRRDVLDNLRDAGPSALLIVSVVNFLLGGILAFVGAVQLRKFAADAYVANLVGLAMVREMSAVMTAIVMSGRTGGAYAARIATMQGNEEIDALGVMGIPVLNYLILPAVLALLITMPLLYLYGCIVGMLGGFVVATSMLDVTATGFIYQTIGAVGFDQFVFGFVKSAAFAVLIGLASCQIGLRAGRSAADVGTAATSAVVVGIVGVIALDAVFAVLADMVGL